MNENRVRLLQSGKTANGTVVYWMSRDQRAYDNWALLFAQTKAAELKTEIIVVFNLVPEFLDASIRQYGFMLKGLQETEKHLAALNIPFFLTIGKPEEEIPKLLKKLSAAILISDFDPLKIKRIWKRKIAKQIDVPFYEVDAHNIVPCLFVSGKEEFAAYTLRPKLHKHLQEFLTEFPEPGKQKKDKTIAPPKIKWSDIYIKLNVDTLVEEIDWIAPGPEAAHKTLENFVANKLENYNKDRNDPNKDAQSNLSPYLHFGQISAQRVALEISKAGDNNESAGAFLEELIVRRELSDNHCYFNKNYDSFNGFREWAKKSLLLHSQDKREFVYCTEEFENAKTHEDLWNAAQTELRKTGKIHGYMRMYWAKKILEWSNSPQHAMETAVYLNDKYALDGRDPNGYTGCAWSIGGVHDRAWVNRSVFGQIRYMNYNGAKRKFDTGAYIKKFTDYKV